MTGDDGPCYYHLRIADERCTFHEGPAAEPAVTIITPVEVWLAIARGELDGTRALMEGKYNFEGDLKLLMRLKSVFSGKTDVPAANHEKSPGPIKIPGMQWLTVAFMPWIY